MTASPAAGLSRYELLRALGAVADSPAAAAAACPALGLADPGPADHTAAFTLNCPPYAAVYLGESGGLGGEACDLVAGFWRAIGLAPPAEPDHLTALLGLYANLGESAREASRPATAGALDRARRALFHEHLWPWLPGYLDAVAELQIPALTAWAALTMRAALAEHAVLAGAAPGTAPAGAAGAGAGAPGGAAAGPQVTLPLALRSAPPPVDADCGLDDLLTALTAPVRSGFILTRQRLAAGAAAAGAGYRIGERRFTLRAMLQQAPAETLGWLAAEAARWQRRHAARSPGDRVQGWWADRAGQAARTLAAAASESAQTPHAAPFIPPRPSMIP